MNTKKIMRLADAYASQLQVCNFADADKARDALEAALTENQGDQDALLDSKVTPHALYYPLSDYHRAPSDGPLNFTWIDKPHRLLYDLIAAVKFYANPAPEAKQEPVDSNEKAGAYMEARLWEFIDMAAAWPQAKPDSRIWDHVLVYAPEAKQEAVAWVWQDGTITKDPDRADGTWTPLYTHPAPVNQQLLEACKAALSDDQPYIEKCRAAIAAAEKEKT